MSLAQVAAGRALPAKAACPPRQSLGFCPTRAAWADSSRSSSLLWLFLCRWKLKSSELLRRDGPKVGAHPLPIPVVAGAVVLGEVSLPLPLSADKAGVMSLHCVACSRPCFALLCPSVHGTREALACHLPTPEPLPAPWHSLVAQVTWKPPGWVYWTPGQLAVPGRPEKLHCLFHRPTGRLVFSSMET